jgi:hypothetical protein
MLLRLPAGGDLGAQPRPQVTLLLRIQVRIQPVQQRLCGSLPASQLGAAR